MSDSRVCLATSPGTAPAIKMRAMIVETIEPESATARLIENIVRARRSIRAFIDREPPLSLVEHILDTAARAPSGTNMQPWQVVVLTGARLRSLGQELARRSRAGDPGMMPYASYPETWREPYLSRRRKVGRDLYAALSITRSDTDEMSAQVARNYVFFDAPVGLLFTIDRDLERGSWLDYGMFLQNIMLLAKAHGLDTCPQQSFVRYNDVILDRLEIPTNRVLVCGMALGYADAAAPENTLASERSPVQAFTRIIADETNATE